MLSFILGFVLGIQQKAVDNFPDIPPKVYAESLPPREETLEEKAAKIAEEFNVPKEKFFNLIESESRWNPNAVNEKTGDYGIVQINLQAHPDVTKEQALNPDFALRWAAKEISEGREWQWVVCSCVSYARALGVDVPKGMDAWDFVPNTTLVNLKKGDLILFKYKNGNSHVEVFWGWKDGKLMAKQTNLKPCKSEDLLIDPSDTSIFGFWSSKPEAS